MALIHKQDFNPVKFDVPVLRLEQYIHSALKYAQGQVLEYFGFLPLRDKFKEENNIRERELVVDNFFRLGNYRQSSEIEGVLTFGLGQSRFAPVLFWEIFHFLRAGGVWLEFDLADAESDSPYLEREYFKDSLKCVSELRYGEFALKVYVKTGTTPVETSKLEDGWTFGVLTAGQSPVAAKIVCDILQSAQGQQDLEIVVCGPLPDGLPSDSRIRHIDLEKPEPRGWITRKKNMIAEMACYENICIMHDRFVFPDNFFAAMKSYGEVFPVLTIPQVFYPHRSHAVMMRYPDYQVLLEPERYYRAGANKIFDSEQIYHLKYDDYYPGAFCCGGLYIAKKSIWNLVRQDESLFHCEWEDVVFGLECQSKGVPHRVNPFALFESTNYHPMLWTGLHVLRPDGTKLPKWPQLSGIHKYLPDQEPGNFKPVFSVGKSEYLDKIESKLKELGLVDFVLRGSSVVRPSQVWGHVYLQFLRNGAGSREQIFGRFQLLADVVFGFPNCILQNWCRNAEVEWGREARGGLKTKMLKAAFPLFFRLALASRQALFLGALKRIFGGKIQTLSPYLDIVAYLVEVEKNYPALFRPPLETSAPTERPDEEEGRARLLEDFVLSEMGQFTIFCRHQGEIVPPAGHVGRLS